MESPAKNLPSSDPPHHQCLPNPALETLVMRVAHRYDSKLVAAVATTRALPAPRPARYRIPRAAASTSCLPSGSNLVAIRVAPGRSDATMLPRIAWSRLIVSAVAAATPAVIHASFAVAREG